MELSGRTVRLKLSRSGVATLPGLLAARIGAKRAVQAFVLAADRTGLWIDNGRLKDLAVELLLIKWEHIEAVGFETKLGEPEERPTIGFR